MAQARSREELLNFLDYLAEKGLMSPVTARSRKASANRVLSILSDEEAADITNLDIDQIMARFSNLEGRKYTPESLMTYKSRVKSAVEDFGAYLSNPLSFRPGAQPRDRRSAGNKLRREVSPRPTGTEPTHSEKEPAAAANILNIPLRSDLIVRIQGLPFDITPAEAKKISNVILAMALPSD